MSKRHMQIHQHHTQICTFPCPPHFYDIYRCVYSHTVTQKKKLKLDEMVDEEMKATRAANSADIVEEK